jgi:hypothetical protein
MYAHTPHTPHHLSTQSVTENFDFSFEGSVSFKLPSLELKFLPPDFQVWHLQAESGTGGDWCCILMSGLCWMRESGLHSKLA